MSARSYLTNPADPTKSDSPTMQTPRHASQVPHHAGLSQRCMHNTETVDGVASRSVGPGLEEVKITSTLDLHNAGLHLLCLWSKSS